MARILRDWGWPRVSAYMDHLRAHAAESVRRVIDGLEDGAFALTMDDGAPLRVAVRIDRATRRATIDFAGTGAQSPGNFNAPPAVTRAVVLYVFRCLIGEDIPLNDGCLEPLDILIPPGSFLAPAPGAAVVAGNTEVSQAVCNTLFGALGVCASAQATMNNLLFGDASRQYYETICGGVGAGPGFDGAATVQTHMTNTRMTDPEVLELRYPVRVEQFRAASRLGRRRPVARRRRRHPPPDVPGADDGGHRLVAPPRRSLRPSRGRLGRCRRAMDRAGRRDHSHGGPRPPRPAGRRRARGRHARRRRLRKTMMGLAMMGLAKMGLAMMGLAMMGLAMMGLAMMGLAMMGLAMMGLAMMGLAMMGLAMMGLAMMGLD